MLCEMPRILLVLIFGLALIGCRTSPNAEREIALLKAEILDLEDRYYQLKSQCAGGEILLSEHTEGPGGEYFYEPSIVIPGGESSAPGARPESLPAPRRGELSSPVGSGLARQPERAQPDRGISSVRISPDFSGGYDRDGVPGDDGVRIQIELLDSAGAINNRFSEMFISLMDAEMPPGQQRIGYWRLTPEDIEDEYSSGPSGSAIELYLPWTEDSPVSSEPTLFIRVVDRHGKVSETSLPVKVESAGLSQNTDAVSGKRVQSAESLHPDQFDATSPARPNWRPFR